MRYSVLTYRAGVTPSAAIPVKSTRSPHHAGRGGQSGALAVVEGDVVHGNVAAGPRRAPDALHNV